MLFEDLALSDDVLDAIDAMHYKECTPIQEQTIPIVLTGRDLIAIGQTGTGKTAAYLLPTIDLLSDLPSPEGYVNCIVMAPTRELAQQIEQQMDAFSYYLPISSIAIYGGTDGATFARQQRAMREGVDMIIATPGRLWVLLQTGGIDLGRVRHFILDEADRMLDMGFYDDIMRIAKLLPADRQTLLFSATMPQKIRRLALNILHDPQEVKIAPSRPVEKIEQKAVMCGSDMEKEARLTDILKGMRGQRSIVFASSKLRVRDLTRVLRRKGIKAAEIHSDLDQQQRDVTVHEFRNLETEVLVATDLLARGIDIDDVALVVNFDLPREPEDYVHRIGRTGRANAEGAAISLVGPKDRRAYSNILAALKIKIPTEGMGSDIGRQDRRGNKDSDRSRRGRNQSSPDKFKGKPDGDSQAESVKGSNHAVNNEQGDKSGQAKKRRWHRRPSKPKSKE